MDIKKIKELYTGLARENLSDREQKLYDLLFADQEQISRFSSLSEEGRYRILQFDLEQFEQIKDSLQLVIPDIVSCNQHYAVERLSNDNLTKSELFEVFTTLSQDIGAEIQVYIGKFMDFSELDQAFLEEEVIFQTNKSFSEYQFAESLDKSGSFLLDKIKAELRLNPEDQKLVQALYQTNGNQAQAAKLLYMHRNTLINKIKKYELKYGLSLSSSDLVLAYNLL